MNDPAVEVVPVETPGYKDRSVGLIIFGILTILAGCLVGLLLPLMIFGQTMAARATFGDSGSLGLRYLDRLALRL